MRYANLLTYFTYFIPFVKSKSGDLADVNNYRAIAISTSVSKLFECVMIADEV